MPARWLPSAPLLRVCARALNGCGGRYAGVAALAGAALLCCALALVVSDASPVPTMLGSRSGQSWLPIGAPKTVDLKSRPREDLDPGSLAGLLQAASGSGTGHDALSAGRTTRLGEETEGEELAQLQGSTTTQADIKKSDSEAPSIRQSIGRTIAKYFTTVRSIKDDQGTFLG